MTLLVWMHTPKKKRCQIWQWQFESAYQLMINQISPPIVWERRSTYGGVWGVVQVWARAPSERSGNRRGHRVIHGLPGAVHPLFVHGFDHLCCWVDNSRRVCRQPSCSLRGLHGDAGQLSRPVVEPWQETGRYSTCLASRSLNYLKGSFT